MLSCLLCWLYDRLCLKSDEITDKYSLFNELDINAEVLFLLKRHIDCTVYQSTSACIFQAMSL